jgi:DNA-directed RNA polymerase specialized sigma subunit
MKPLSNKPIHLRKTSLQSEINNLIKSIDEVAVDEELAKHIEAIRNGDESKIEDVIKSSEVLVLKVISQFDKMAVPLEEMINCANESLIKLATKEFNNKGKAIYLRFCAFTIKQSVLEFDKNSYSFVK